MYETAFEASPATPGTPCNCPSCLVKRSALSEATAAELAAELLGLGSEAELDRFFGKIFRGIKKGIGAIGRFAKKGISALGRGLKAVGKVALPALKGLAKVGLPILGKVAGGFFGGPVGAALGSKLGSFAGKLVGGLEMEMGSLEQEHEVARRYVHFVADSARNLMRRPSTGDPEQDAIAAMTLAARRIGRPIVRPSSRAGRWFRAPEGLVLMNA